MPWESLNTALAEADILITATGASTPIISRALIAQTMKARRQRPLFIIDIAVPRDVEAERRRSRAGVPLQHRRPAGGRAGEHLEARHRSVGGGEDRLAGGRQVRRLAQFARRRARPSSRCGSDSKPIRQSELRRLEPKLASLPPEARARVDEITRLIVEKLLINPTEQLKSISDADTVAAYSDALNRLFGLAGDESPDEAR